MMNEINFSAEYSKQSDDELLELASDRSSLTAEAAVALDNELRRRNLTEFDRAKHQQLVRHEGRRERVRRSRRIFGTRNDRNSWVDVFWSFLAVVSISGVYVALPRRYHMKPDWQEAALHVLFASAFVFVVGRPWWGKTGFWVSLLLSSAIQLFVVQVWIQRAGSLSSKKGQAAILLGWALFLAIYCSFRLLWRSIYGREISGSTRKDD